MSIREDTDACTDAPSYAAAADANNTANEHMNWWEDTNVDSDATDAANSVADAVADAGVEVVDAIWWDTAVTRGHFDAWSTDQEFPIVILIWQTRFTEIAVSRKL